VLINNVATFLTPPVEGSLSQKDIFDYTGGYAMVVPVVVGDLQRANPVSVRFIVDAHVYIGNVHIEVDFPLGSSPPYTSPAMWYGKVLEGPVFHPGASKKMGFDSCELFSRLQLYPSLTLGRVQISTK
jgi:hypothetical protein